VLKSVGVGEDGSLSLLRYKDHGNFPPQLYVRASNRLQGVSFLTQNNISNPQVKPDAVAMGCWTFDQHTVSRHAVPGPAQPGGGAAAFVTTNEGFFRQPTGSSWYDVPFGVMVPKRGQASNLLVPVAISVSSVAYASARIENMFMDLGSAAGVAVALLLESAADAAAAAHHVGSRPPSRGGCPTGPFAVQNTNVTAVQHVLSTVYKQAFHGLKPRPTPPPAPPSPPAYVVGGAGDAMWNGVYSRAGSYNGRSVSPTPRRPCFDAWVCVRVYVLVCARVRAHARAGTCV
jgi:hypothetical protein